MRVRVRTAFQQLVRDELEHPGITAEAEFYVLEVDDEYYRVVNRFGEPTLYPKELFEVLDPSIPSGWRFTEYEEGEYHLEPATTGRPGFYEDWHGSDGDRVAQRSARDTFRLELLRTASEVSAADRKLIEEALSRLPASIEPPMRPVVRANDPNDPTGPRRR